MDPEVTSVFDLSPAEKLQLVEDLWDDLAATRVPRVRYFDPVPSTTLPAHGVGVPNPWHPDYPSLS